MTFPALTIGNFTVSLPIIQGGMAIRISTASLAAAVAREGGIGVIAGTGMSSQELRDEIRKAKELAGDEGKIGVNVLFAASNFAILIKEAMAAGIDLIIYGAGFSKDIFKLGKEYNCPIVPIVSSARLAKTAEKLGAAAIIVEGCEAGGHLGTDRPLKELIPEIRKVTTIPIIGAGGISSGEDMYNVMKLGANGVQIATKFAASEESNASQEFKNVYMSSVEGDSVLINSPVGLPGRAVKTSFSEAIINGDRVEMGKCTSCLKRCNKVFCIKSALENAQMGVIDKGLVFAGIDVHKITEILPVKEIMSRFIKEFEETSKRLGGLWND
ncbi:MAG: 2-nitropropane dioxygenase [Desulfitibacter sp. BRH_c19]|nr:MAG: 2-nitropropane dioxygenase [Desulfitibacter sp. BRH_c19]